jgi:hypothetical protein
MGVAVLGSLLRDRIGALATATVAVLLVSPSLIVLNDWREGGTFLLPPPRYGLSAMPMLAILIAWVAERTKIATSVVTVLAAGLYLSALGSLAF